MKLVMKQPMKGTKPKGKIGTAIQGTPNGKTKVLGGPKKANTGRLRPS